VTESLHSSGPYYSLVLHLTGAWNLEKISSKTEACGQLLYFIIAAQGETDFCHNTLSLATSLKDSSCNPERSLNSLDQSQNEFGDIEPMHELSKDRDSES